MVCHCLLVETRDGLVLIDTGIGLGDIGNPLRLGLRWVRQTTPRLDPAESAMQQVKAVGYAPPDVRQLVLSHLDRDQVSGIPDCPNAELFYSIAVRVIDLDRKRSASMAHMSSRRLASMPMR